MVKLLIDTCVWLDIAKTTKGEKVLDILIEFLDREDISLICPTIIISEFQRNKDRIIADAGKSLSSHFKKVKEMVAVHGGQEIKEKVLSQLNDIDHKIPTLGENAFSSIQRIEELLEKSEKIPISDKIKLRAAQRAIDKKAPFHLAKNSIGDAIIIESYLEYKLKNESQVFRLIFITHNKNDFSLVGGNHKLPHLDLAKIFDSPKSQYFINLLEALNSVNPELVEDIEVENDWFYEPRGLTEMMEVERELGEKIWYNRHQNRAYRISQGEIEVIKHEDFNVKTSNATIVDDIWEGAKKSAKAVEDRYGIDNLKWNDFEWGMINGKLSAIRWVVGEDWDSLYT